MKRSLLFAIALAALPLPALAGIAGVLNTGHRRAELCPIEEDIVLGARPAPLCGPEDGWREAVSVNMLGMGDAGVCWRLAGDVLILRFPEEEELVCMLSPKIVRWEAGWPELAR